MKTFFNLQFFISYPQPLVFYILVGSYYLVQEMFIREAWKHSMRANRLGKLVFPWEVIPSELNLPYSTKQIKNLTEVKTFSTYGFSFLIHCLLYLVQEIFIYAIWKHSLRAIRLRKFVFSWEFIKSWLNLSYSTKQIKTPDKSEDFF